MLGIASLFLVTSQLQNLQLWPLLQGPGAASTSVIIPLPHPNPTHVPLLHSSSSTAVDSAVNTKS